MTQHSSINKMHTVEEGIVGSFANIVVESNGEFRPEFCAENFAGITSESAIELLETRGAEDATYINLDLETRLWSLVETVYSVRQHKGSTKELVHATLDWLREGVRPPPRPPLHSIKWMYTKKHVQSLNGPKLNPNNSTVSLLVTELDADAPLRENRGVSNEDAEADATFFQYVFELVRSGKLAEASKVCAETNNWQLKVAIDAAMNDNQSPTVSSLVRRAYAAVAKSTGLGKYERGIYGLLGGDIDTVLPLSTDWETHLLACVNSLAVGLDVVPPSPKSPTCRDLLEPPRSVRSISEALQLTSESANHKIAAQAQELHRRVMRAVLLGTADEFITELAAQTENDIVSDASTIVLLDNPWLVRILLHMQLLFGGEPTPALVILMRIYIDYLDVKGLTEYFPCYISLLPPEAQLLAYPPVLAKISDSESRQQQLDLIKLRGRGCINIRDNVVDAIRLVVRNTALPPHLPAGATIGPTLADTSKVTSDDERLVDSLDWLIQAHLWEDAVNALIDLSKEYLLGGRPLVGMAIASQLQRAVVATREKDIRETNTRENDIAYEFVQLATALRHIQAWDNLEHGDDRRARETEHIGTILEAVRPALGFMAQFSDDDELAQLRQMYVPFVVFELLRVLSEARKANKHYLSTALDLAPLIADEDLGIYQLFETTSQLPRLFDTFASLWVDTL